MFSKDLELTIGQCYKEAREQRHEFMTVEHLLLALLENPSAAAVLKACGADVTKLGKDLKAIILETVPVLPVSDERDTQPTLGFQRVLQRAVYHVQSSGRKEVTGANVLVAIFGEKDSHAVYFLNQQEVARLDVVNYIAHGVAKIGQDPAIAGQRRSEAGRRGRRRTARQSAQRVRQQPQRSRASGQDRSADRPRRGNRAHDPGAVPPPQEQSAVRRRSRRRQDRAGRRSGQAHRRRRCAGNPQELHHLFARHGRAGRRHEISRRFRKAFESRHRRTEEAAERDPVHRRNPHHHRCGFGVGRNDGCVEPDQARARLRRTALHRLDHVPGIPRRVREGSRAGAALPEDRRRRTDDRRSRSKSSTA